ncbi:MAG: aryl-sulfate sulfotransferase [Phaeodactylibacter sp.]|nr:aryl-sulfate sulfotransferase [Phaeodactylibacter sp.]
MKRPFFLPLLLLLLTGSFGCRKEEPPGLPEPREVSIDSLLSEPIRIEMNPYGLTPLAGRATIRTKGAARLEVRGDGQYPMLLVSDSLSIVHEVLLLGLYPGRENALRFKVTEHEGNRFGEEALLVSTPPLPAYLPDIEIVEKDEGRMEPGWNLIELGLGPGHFLPLIFDPSGQIRWYMEIDFIKGGVAPFKRLRNGHWLWANGQTVFEHDMLGREVNRWEVPGYAQHHDLAEKPDGNLLLCVTKEGLDTGLDHIIELNRQSGQAVREWDLRQVLDVDRFDLFRHSYDWLHVNSVWFDEADQGLVVSARYQGIFKVSRDNRLEWILAPHQGWGAAGPDGLGASTAGYLLTAVDATGTPYNQAVQQGAEDAPAFSWPWGQHAAMILPGGNIFCFDNGWKKNFGENAGYIRAVEYRVDPEEMQVKQTWEYGKARGAEIYSHNVCDVDYLEVSGNRLLCSGNIDGAGGRQGRLIEVSFPEGEVIFEALIRYRNGPVDDIIYRAERLPLYPE